MNSECPLCGQPAMTLGQRITKRPQVCQHCGARVRLSLIYTAALSLLYFALAVRILLGFGISGTALLYMLALTVGFVAVCLCVPFEEKPEA